VTLAKCGGVNLLAPEAPELVAACRAMEPGRLCTHVFTLQAMLGHRFNFDVLGEILLRATDDELVNLHLPRRVPR
jgi:hypothetical protein